MKSLPYRAFSSAMVLSLMVACAPKSADLSAPPPVDPGQLSASAAIAAQVSLAPKVDILFVVDTSDSMLTHQEKLKANIDRFAEAFKEHNDIDFHIGVVSVYDSSRYDKVVPAPYPLGKLRPLKDPAHPGQVLPEPSFVSLERFKDMASATSILGESLKVGIEPRFKYTLDDKGRTIYEYVKDASGAIKKDERGRAVKVDGGGPENEELFNEIEPALLSNAGFYRKDAHLAIIMLTDADDGSSIPSDQLRDKLWEMKGHEPKLVSAYAALALSATCPKDPGLQEAGGDPKKIRSLVSDLGGKVMDLCDNNYGDKLAAVGRAIQEKAMSLVRVQLAAKPEGGTLKVTYNGKELDGDKGRAWSYDEVYNKVIIHGDHPSFAKAPGGKLEVTFTPIDMKWRARGRVIPVGY